MIKKLFTLTSSFLLTFSIFTAEISAQNEMNWDAKFALGLGFTPAWVIPDFSTFNSTMKNVGFATGEFPSGGFAAWGGAGHVSLPMIKNLRIGGMGFGGSVSRKTRAGQYEREARYSASLGGFTIEYTLPFIHSVAVSVGSLIGGGSTTLELYENTGSLPWDDVWIRWGESPPADNLPDAGFSRKIYNSYFTLTPTLNIDIPVYRFLAFRIGAGYQFALNNTWHMDNGTEIRGVPDKLKSDWFFIQTGIFIGYFSY